MDDDTWAFWNEQERPTPAGAGGKSRVDRVEPLPDPLPPLVAPPKEEEEEETEEPGWHGGDQPQGPAGEMDFTRAYGGRETYTIMDVDGQPIAVPDMTTFEEAVEQLRFPPFLHAALAQRSFYQLTPVQQCTMPLLLAGRDFMASAFTGSGKTAAYLLPILTSLDRLSRLIPGQLVAAHFKVKSGGRSAKPILGTVKGVRQGMAAIEFEQATGLAHRQLVPPDWVVGVPTQQAAASWQGPARPFAVVLVPTRELSEQVHEEARSFTTYTQLRSVALYGSSGIRRQLRDLAHGADIVVATPGRLVDALRRGVCQLDRVRHLVIDEVDRMMELGFGSQLEEIVEQGGMATAMTGGRQTSFWSATLPPSVRQLTEAFLGKECVWVDCTGGQTNPVPATIRHVLVDARPPHRVLRRFEEGSEVITNQGRRGIIEFKYGKRWRVMFTDGDLMEHKMVQGCQLSLLKMKSEQITLDRLDLLHQILKSREFRKGCAIVFCRRRETVSEAFQFLKEKFLGVVICHGGMSQAQRNKSIQDIRDGKAEVLVATDMAARGLDLPTITHVVNYELPNVVDEFVHRCGRTGRIGREGTVVTMVTGREKIFKAVRRTILAQTRDVPEWFSLEGMYLPWRPRFYKPPFRKVKVRPSKDATWEERRAYLEKQRNQSRKMKAFIMRKALAVTEMTAEEREQQVREREERRKAGPEWIEGDPYEDGEYEEGEYEIEYDEEAMEEPLPGERLVSRA